MENTLAGNAEGDPTGLNSAVPDTATQPAAFDIPRDIQPTIYTEVTEEELETLRQCEELIRQADLVIGTHSASEGQCLTSDLSSTDNNSITFPQYIDNDVSSGLGPTPYIAFPFPSLDDSTFPPSLPTPAEQPAMPLLAPTPIEYVARTSGQRMSRGSQGDNGGGGELMGWTSMAQPQFVDVTPGPHSSQAQEFLQGSSRAPLQPPMVPDFQNRRQRRSAMRSSQASSSRWLSAAPSGSLTALSPLPQFVPLEGRLPTQDYETEIPQAPANSHAPPAHQTPRHGSTFMLPPDLEAYMISDNNQSGSSSYQTNQPPQMDGGHSGYSPAQNMTVPSRDTQHLRRATAHPRHLMHLEASSLTSIASSSAPSPYPPPSLYLSPSPSIAPSPYYPSISLPPQSGGDGPSHAMAESMGRPSQTVHERQSEVSQPSGSSHRGQDRSESQDTHVGSGREVETRGGGSMQVGEGQNGGNANAQADRDSTASPAIPPPPLPKKHKNTALGRFFTNKSGLSIHFPQSAADVPSDSITSLIGLHRAMMQSLSQSDFGLNATLCQPPPVNPNPASSSTMSPPSPGRTPQPSSDHVHQPVFPRTSRTMLAPSMEADRESGPQVPRMPRARYMSQGLLAPPTSQEHGSRLGRSSSMFDLRARGSMAVNTANNSYAQPSYRQSSVNTSSHEGHSEMIYPGMPFQGRRPQLQNGHMPANDAPHSQTDIPEESALLRPTSVKAGKKKQSGEDRPSKRARTTSELSGKSDEDSSYPKNSKKPRRDDEHGAGDGNNYTGGCNPGPSKRES